MEKLFARFCFFLGLAWCGFISVVAFFPLLLNEKLGHRFERVFAIVCCKLLGLRVRIEGLENLKESPSFVLAPNHASMFDIFVVYLLPLKFRWIAKRQLARVPLFGWSLWASGTYFVRRDSSGHDVRVTMRRVEEGLKKGKSVLMFPEGTRSRTGELLPFKKGAFKVAQNTGIPMLPIALIGTYDIAPPKQLPVKWGHSVTMRIGKPFFVKSDESMEAAMARFREEFLALRGNKMEHS